MTAGDPGLGELIAVCAERLGADATAVLARLAGPLGEAAREAAISHCQLADPERQRRRADVVARARARDLRAVHPTWIDAALVDLPARARTALGPDGDDPVDVWLARWATAALPPAFAPETAELAALVLREPAVLLAWLRAIALDQLAFALGASAPPVLHAARDRIARAPRVNALGPHKAALARCRGVTLDDDAALVALASRALAPHLAPYAIARMHLTRRLPLALGSIVDRECGAHAATAISDVPAWAALIAP